MNVIFLDIDGVLNSARTKETLWDGFLGVDVRLCKLLLNWIRGKNINFVLSSSWKAERQYKAHLNSHGIAWVAQTPERSCRGEEIQHVLETLSIDQYAILDDFGPAEFLEHQRPYLVRTSPRYGLTKKSLSQLENIFLPD